MVDFSDLAKIIKQKDTIITKDNHVAPTAADWLEELEQWLEGDYNKIVPPPRSPGLHASGLYQVCARKEWLLKYFNPPAPKIVAGQQMTFDIGTAMHWWWQNRYLGPKQELWGDWFCSGCKTTTRGFMVMDCPCGADWRTNMRYEELPVEDKVLKFTGHCDGVLVDRKSSFRRVFEFKSTSQSAWDKIFFPKAAHVIQAHAYMRGLGLTEALIVYANKGQQCYWTKEAKGFKPGRSKVKTFVVEFDTSIWTEIERRIKNHESALKELQTILDEGKKITEQQVVNQERICKTEEDDAAEYCPVREQCFAMQAISGPRSLYSPELKEFKSKNGTE